MPSQDEQIILEDLNRFPEQILSRERNQVIVENIRKERRLMQKLKKRRQYFGWMAKGIITCVALFAIIWIKTFTTSVETTGSKPVETGSKPVLEQDQKYFTAAQKEIKAMGINKDFHFEEIEKDPDYFIVRTKNQESVVTFKPNTTEVRTVSATVSINELPNNYQKYIETARDAFKEANQHVFFQKVHFFKGYEETTLSFWLGDDQHVSIDLKTNKVSNFSLYYKLGDVDKKYVSIAQRALMLLSNVSNNNSFSFTQAKKSSTSGEDMWRLTNEQEKYYVEIGAKTGQVYRVHYVTDHYKIKSKDEAISVTKPLIKNIFGIDITGYKADGGEHWGGYVLTSQGKPNIRVFLADLDIGTISGIQIDRD
ncbi:hypothetical protein [Brevibacillus daliensis]|uniref:hypothetical protein n=1 Tax=Brevibacillus daliensis TaxID=2892995 RepID=UPI001E34703B|nr:hypothetical protein [Brevibacillus daliensis]